MIPSPIVVASEAAGGQVGVADATGAGRWLPVPATFYLTAGAVGSLVYATSGGQGGSVHTLRVTAGGLVAVHVLADIGEFPCHLALAPDGSALAVADYQAGVVVIADLVDGVPTGALRRVSVPMPGRVPPQERQVRPHPHFCLFESPGRLLVTSLGGDRLWTVDVASLRLDSSACHDGAGPRHLVRDGTGALWATGELDSTVLRLDAQLRETHAHSLLPAGWSGANYPSDVVAIGGRWIVAANRGADTLVVFDALHPDAGRIAEVSCGGAWPAQLLATGEGSLLVANTHTDAVRRFTLGADGVPVPDDWRLSVPRPLAVCVVG